jgi:hypothetical protein
MTSTVDNLVKTLRLQFNDVKTMDPSSDVYKKFRTYIDNLDTDTLELFKVANIKFVSILAANTLRKRTA